MFSPLSVAVSICLTASDMTGPGAEPFHVSLSARKLAGATRPVEPLAEL